MFEGGGEEVIGLVIAVAAISRIAKVGVCGDVAIAMLGSGLRRKDGLREEGVRPPRPCSLARAETQSMQLGGIRMWDAGDRALAVVVIYMCAGSIWARISKIGIHGGHCMANTTSFPQGL